MTTTKLVVTHRGKLRKKYKAAGWTKIDAALKKLIAADAARGIATTVVALDTLTPSKAVVNKPKTFKAAIDQAFLAYNRPDYVLILGGPDVVPHQPLRNPLFDPQGQGLGQDRAKRSAVHVRRSVQHRHRGLSRTVACRRTPAGSATLQPSPTARRADRPGGEGHGGAQRRQRVLRPVVRRMERLDDQESGEDLRRRIQAAAVADGRPGVDKAALGPGWHFINCHGAPKDPQFYGQQGEDYPVSHHSPKLSPGRSLPERSSRPSAATAPEIYNPGTKAGGIGVAYLREGAMGYLGSTNIAYGPEDDNDCADLMCRYFLESARSGASLGRALLEARQKYIAGAVPVDPSALKTAGSSCCWGIRPFMPSPARSRRPALSQDCAPGPPPDDGQHSCRHARRSHRNGRSAGRGADSVKTGVRTTSNVAVRSKFASTAAKAGLVTAGPVRVFQVAAASDPSARDAVVRRAPKEMRTGAKSTRPGSVRFHVCFATTTDGRPSAVAKAGRRTAAKAQSPRLRQTSIAAASRRPASRGVDRA